MVHVCREFDSSNCNGLLGLFGVCGFFFRFIVTVMMTIVSTFLLFAFDKDLIMLMLNVTIVIYIVVLFNGVKYIHVDLLITIIIMKE